MAKWIRRTENETSWIEIQEMVDQGMATGFSAGDEVIDTLKNGSEMGFAVAAVNHYQDDELIFVMTQCIVEDAMNEKMSNAGGWTKSCLRRRANTDIMALLPDELVKRIAPRKIMQVIQGERYECEDRLWIPSEKELFGTVHASEDNGIDRQFPFYKIPSNRPSVDVYGNAVAKWTSSPNRFSSYAFVGLHASGYQNNHYLACSRYGVSLAFCIRNSKGICRL